MPSGSLTNANSNRLVEHERPPRHTASHQRQLHARLALTVPLILLLAGCLTTPRPSTTALIDALPSQVDGIELGTVNTIDDSFMSGHPLDDALARLSLDRTAASAVFRGAADGRLEVGAVAVEGAGGPRVLDAMAETWYGSSTVRASRLELGDGAWRLEGPLGSITVVYLQSDVVYVVSSRHDALRDEALKHMP